MDKIFKIGLLVLGVGYLVYLFCPSNQVGRYQYHRVGAVQKMILDTTTMDMYLYTNKWEKKNAKKLTK